MYREVRFGGKSGSKAAVKHLIQTAKAKVNEITMDKSVYK